MREQGSDFDSAFAEFSCWRAIVGVYDDGAHFIRGSGYDPPAVALSIPLSSFSSEPITGHAYGSRYIDFTEVEKAPFGLWTIDLVVDPDTVWSSSLLLWRDQAPVERIQLSFEEGLASAQIENSSDISKVLLVVSQHSSEKYNPDDMAYDKQKEFSFKLTAELYDEEPSAQEECLGSDGDGGVPENSLEELASEKKMDASVGHEEPKNESSGGCTCQTARPSLPDFFLLLIGVILSKTLRQWFVKPGC